MQREVYRTRRLVLRPLEESDFETWCRSCELSEPKRDKWDLDGARLLKATTRALFRKSVLRQRRAAKADDYYLWNIFLRSTGELVGWTDLSTIKREPYQAGNVGYFVINIYRGRGYAREATIRTIRAGFEDLKYHRLEAVTDIDNRASIRVAKSCGMHREGVKKHYWFQNGRWEDQMVYVATPEIWPSARTKRFAKQTK